MRLKLKDLTGKKFPTYMGNNFLSFQGVNSNSINREFANSLLVDSLLRKERITMALSVKASEYQNVLNNHLKAVETTLRGAGIKEKSVIDNGMKEAEKQFRLDYVATGGKHEDFFDSKCTAQLGIVNKEIRILNKMNPTGKAGVSVEVGTICKKA